MPEKPQEVAQSLDPHGTINFEYRCWRDVADQPMHHYLRLNPNDCSIRYSKFPYQINNIRGQLEMRDHFWTFRNLKGMNESAQITGEGDLTPSLQGNKFVLNLTANNVPLDQELHNALAPNIHQAWNDLKPQGMVDLTAQICYLSEQKQLSLGVSVVPKSETTSIEPVHFPYRMDKLQGALLYQDGQVTLQQIKAKHGPVTISTEGSCDFLPDGGWNMHFGGLRIGPIDRDLILALPERLKKAVLTLNPAGRIDLCGNLDLIHDGRQGEPLQSQWDDLRINMLQGAMQCGVKLENIFGDATLSGHIRRTTISSAAENLILDSLNFKDYQFKQCNRPDLDRRPARALGQFGR